jgi:hypothetical protein
MNLQNQPPIFVPIAYRREIEALSKATLMDMVWDYAKRCAADPIEGEATDLGVIEELRKTAKIITMYRNQEKSAWQARQAELKASLQNSG